MAMDFVYIIFFLILGISLFTIFRHISAMRSEAEARHHTIRTEVNQSLRLVTQDLNMLIGILKKEDVEILTAKEVEMRIRSHRIAPDHPVAVMAPSRLNQGAGAEADVPELAPGREVPNTFAPKSSPRPSSYYRKSITEILRADDEDGLIEPEGPGIKDSILLNHG